VVQITPNPVIYAKALLKLEQTRENNMRMAMAATGKKYQLLNRIERIMKTKKPTQSIRPALLAMLILTIGIGSIALLNPEIAQGKISVKAIVPAFTNLLTDTVKKTAAKKTARLQAHTGKTHVHTKVHKNDVYFDSEGEDKTEMELNAEIQKHADAISKFYNSGEFKNAQQQLEQKGKEMQAFYDRPELKRMQEEMNRVSANFSKTWSNNDNDKASKLSLQMGEKGNAIGAYYSSPGFKKMNRELKAKYGIPQDQEYFDDRNNENYKKYQEELSSRIPASVKQTQDDLKSMGEQVRKHYESPEYKAQSNQLRELGDSIKNAYHNPAMQQQREEMRKLSEQMRAYQNSPEIKRQQELLKESVKKLTAYVNSPAFKNYVRRMKSYSYNYNFDDNIDRPERPEKPERPERPEKMQKEAPEKPEAPETPAVPPANAPTPPAPPAD
jgi:bla regulator protein BlaR1